MFAQKLRSVVYSRHLSSYIRSSGWMRSFVAKSPQDGNGQPIPWIPRPAYLLLEQRILPSFRVFEYGAGNSTLWFASRCESVIAIEHDVSWYNSVKSRVPPNAEILYSELNETSNYEESIKDYAAALDIAIVDGRRRNECIMQIVESSLKDSTVVILDNSERAEYTDGISMLTSNGYRHLQLCGLAPGHGAETSCSFFYKSANVLGI